MGYDDTAFFEEQEREYLESQQWSELIDLYEEEARSSYDDAHILEIKSRQARVLEEPLERIDEAIRVWREVLDVDPMHTEGLDALARLYLEQERWYDLVEVLETRADLSEEKDERIELLSQVGAIYGDQLDRKSSAIETWEDILELDPDHARALEELALLFHEREHWSRYIEILERQLEIGELAAEERAELLASLAVTFEKHRYDERRALELWREVLTLDPAHPEAREAVERLAERFDEDADLPPMSGDEEDSPEDEGGGERDGGETEEGEEAEEGEGESAELEDPYDMDEEPELPPLVDEDDEGARAPSGHRDRGALAELEEGEEMLEERLERIEAERMPLEELDRELEDVEAALEALEMRIEQIRRRRGLPTRDEHVAVPVSSEQRSNLGFQIVLMLFVSLAIAFSNYVASEDLLAAAVIFGVSFLVGLAVLRSATA